MISKACANCLISCLVCVEKGFPNLPTLLPQSNPADLPWPQTIPAFRFSTKQRNLQAVC